MEAAGGGDTIPFHTFLWKIGSRCNINCSYCYVYNSVDDGWRHQPKLMSREVAETTASRMVEHLTAHGKRSASIIFHGGEPLLGGTRHLGMLSDVIREAFEGTAIHVTLGMQTNLLLLTEEIADFLVQRGFSIGVSLDGPPHVNDVHRVDRRGRPTSARLEEKLALLLEPRYRHIFGGFLCVIDPQTDPVEVTDYLLSYDPVGIDFLFPLDNHDRRPRGKEDLLATPYGDWLTRSYDHWIARPNATRVRVFQSIINMICGGTSLAESLGLRPVDLIVIETNGDIEAVDSLKATFNGATQLGFNVERDSFQTVSEHIGVRSRQLGAEALTDVCQRCRLVDICGGGYLPHRYSTARGFDNPSVYCEDLKLLITHIHDSVSTAITPVVQAATDRAQANGFSSSAGMARAHEPIVALAKDVTDEAIGAVMDLGCGDGTLAHRIATETGLTPFGFDIDPDRAAVARELLAACGGDARTANLYSDEWPWPGARTDLCIVPAGAFIEAPADLADVLRQRLAQHARTVIAYAYDDDLQRFGSLAAMSEQADLPLVAGAVGEVAGLVDVELMVRAGTPPRRVVEVRSVP